MTNGPILWGGNNTANNLQNNLQSPNLLVLNQGAVQFNNSGNTFSTSLLAGANTANASFNLPIADGTSGQFLSTNGSGVLSFASPSGGGAPTYDVTANDSNVVFTSASNPYQLCNPTIARTYTLPSSGVTAGQVWTFFNQAISQTLGVDAYITLIASDSTIIDYVLTTGFTQIVPLSATPSTAADWVTINAGSSWIQDQNPNTFSSGTSASNMGRFYKRVNDSIYMHAEGNLGNTTSSTLEWNIPNSWTIRAHEADFSQVGWANSISAVTAQININMYGGNNYLVITAQGAYETPLPGTTFTSPVNGMLVAWNVPVLNWGYDY